MAPPVRRYKFTRIGPLGWTVMALLALGLGSTGVDMAHDFRLLGLVDAIEAGDEGAFDRLLLVSGEAGIRPFVDIGILIVSAIVFLVWVYRAHANLHALGLLGLKFSPGWAVLWWFIPLANLIQPARAMAELFRTVRSHDPAAAPGAAAQRQTGIAPVVVWWLLVLLANGAFRYAARQMGGESLEAVRHGIVVGLAGSVMFVVAGLFAIWLVYRISTDLDAME